MADYVSPRFHRVRIALPQRRPLGQTVLDLAVHGAGGVLRIRVGVAAGRR